MGPSFARQRESFPKIDVLATKTATERLDAAVCVFELNRNQGGQVGQLFVADVEDSCILVKYMFAIEHIFNGEGKAVLKIKPSPTPLDKFRMVFECPTCQQNKWALYYDKVWACANCLGLSYRSQLVDKQVTYREAHDTLKARLARGRPKGMHNRTYMDLLMQLARLKRMIGDRPRIYPSDAHDLVISERWVAGSDVDLWSSSYMVRGGSFVRVDSLTSDPEPTAYD